MAVEALKIIREGEEAGRKLLEDAKANVAKILNDAEDEIKILQDKARENEQRLAAEISATYVQEGKKEEEAILKAAEDEANTLKAATESNLDNTVNVVLERVLGMR